MKLTELIRLNEGKQVGEVYHFTGINAFINIIEQDFLKARENNRLSFQMNMNDKHSHYLSTTRDRNFTNRQKAHIGGSTIGLILDGNKLSSNYKTLPFDDNIVVNRKWGSVSKKKYTSGYGDEMEQVWFGKRMDQDNGIKNIDNYIVGIILTKKFYDRVKDTPGPELISYIKCLDLIIENGYEAEKYDGSDVDVEYMKQVLEKRQEL